MPKKTSVNLVSHTLEPIKTLFAIWHYSRTDEPLSFPPEDEQLELFRKIMAAGIPVAENVSFTFALHHVSISLREQLVRHRVGVKVGDRVGIDHAPNLADSTFWAQSMRILDMGTFAEEGRYALPDSVVKAQIEWERQGGARVSGPQVDYEKAMRYAENSYEALKSHGVPLEDARNVIPLAATSTIVWTLNLASLLHIVGKRGCWILQLGLWEPVIRGMVEALAEEIHPVFREIISPPCISGDCFNGCKFKLDNERRVVGEDEIPPCSLYLKQHGDEARGVADAQNVLANVNDAKPSAYSCVGKSAGTEVWEVFGLGNDRKASRFAKMREDYSNLWGRDPFSGERIDPDEEPEVRMPAVVVRTSRPAPPLKPLGERAKEAGSGVLSGDVIEMNPDVELELSKQAQLNRDLTGEFDEKMQRPQPDKGELQN